MDRRGFFRKALKDSGEVVVKHAVKKAKQAATHWIRPPFAVDELEFLLACTRCNACAEACPHDVIFNLSPRLGVKVAGTPALDLANKGCHLCEDWPCVTACEAKALTLPVINQTSPETPLETSNNKISPPQLAIAQIDTESCLPYNGPECGACNSSCPIPNALIWNLQKPEIDMKYCVGCGLCREACINNPSAIHIQTLQ